MSAQGDLRQTLVQRAQELFALCDSEGKGFAFKEELGALSTELPLSPEQLDSVFDTLDADGDGKLTLQEFTDGFGMFLGIDSYPRTVINGEEDEDEDEILDELLDHLGARNLFTDEDYVREMWHRVRKDDPVMRSNFENFICKVAADLKDSAADKESLESTMKSREQESENRVQSLYTEMEEQMQQEKEKALARERRKEQQLRDELEFELQLKDQQLHELLEKHSQIEKQLAELNSEEAGTKYENKKLEKDRDILESRLAASERMLQDMKNQLSLLRKKSLEEKRKRAQAALKVSENIALERENLVLELQTLKEKNKQLLDENDELVQNVTQQLPGRKSIERKKPSEEGQIDEAEGTMEKRKIIYSESGRTLFTESDPLTGASFCQTSLDPKESKLVLEFKEDEEDDAIRNNLNFPQTKSHNSAKQNVNSSGTQMNTFGEAFPKSELKPTIKEKKSDKDVSPSRVFKIVFVGDSGVGKTSILQRFCTNDFKSTYSATVGVDFQVKSVKIGVERIVLQLWDTAGQERFRSMTQQYFRKADGIIVVYDVSVETSFKNVRNWMHSIKEAVQDTSVILLLGNKIDLCESDDKRVVKTKDGERMADEFETLFYEVSAKEGSYITEAVEGLASVLKTKEDEAIEHILKLENEIKEKRKKKCC